MFKEWDGMIGKILKQLRNDMDLTQAELAKKIGVTTSSIGMYETEVRNPSYEVVVKLANFFNVSTDYLLGNTDSKNDVKPAVPKEYLSKHKVTNRDLKQYQEEMKKSTEAFFLNDELSEDAKKEMLDLMSELFWIAKEKNKRKKK